MWLYNIDSCRVIVGTRQQQNARRQQLCNTSRKRYVTLTSAVQVYTINCYSGWQMKVSSVWNMSGTAWESNTRLHRVQTTRHLEMGFWFCTQRWSLTAERVKFTFQRASLDAPIAIAIMSVRLFLTLVTVIHASTVEAVETCFNRTLRCYL